MTQTRIVCVANGQQSERVVTSITHYKTILSFVGGGDGTANANQESSRTARKQKRKQEMPEKINTRY